MVYLSCKRAFYIFPIYERFLNSQKQHLQTPLRSLDNHTKTHPVSRFSYSLQEGPFLPSEKLRRDPSTSVLFREPPNSGRHVVDSVPDIQKTSVIPRPQIRIQPSPTVGGSLDSGGRGGGLILSVPPSFLCIFPSSSDLGSVHRGIFPDSGRQLSPAYFVPWVRDS